MVAASVIVRAKNKHDTIEAAFESVRGQTVAAQIILVDSGSTDGTIAIARRYADEVIEIPAATFSYGNALNVGARAAEAPVHIALSAHCTLPRADWIERALAHFERPHVAAVNGREANWDDPAGIVVQDLAHARKDLQRGFSNHAAAWLASVWETHPFDEHLGYAEDKEWALRVLVAGHRIVYDPELVVSRDHQWRQGIRQFYRREREFAQALSSFAEPQPFGLRELAEEWWAGGRDHRPAWQRRLSPRRNAGLAGRFRGYLGPVRLRR